MSYKVKIVSCIFLKNDRSNPNIKPLRKLRSLSHISIKQSKCLKKSSAKKDNAVVFIILETKDEFTFCCNHLLDDKHLTYFN